MKKIITVLFLSVFLCGCTADTLAESEYNVSALGFDFTENKYSIFAEVIAVNSEEPKQETIVIFGQGKSPQLAFEKLLRKSTQKPILSHCALLVIGSGIKQKQLDEICEFVYKKRINLSSRIIACSSAEALLSAKAISSLAVGYDIMGLLEQFSSKDSTTNSNRFFEVLEKRNIGEGYLLPLIEINGEEYSLAKQKICIP